MRNILVFCVALFAAPTCLAASFDCAKAKTAAEIAICGSDELSHRDVIVSDTYRKASEMAGAKAARALAREGLQARAACGSDARCIAATQQSLVNALSALIDSHGGRTRVGAKIFYGSRAGMQVTATSAQGLGTTHAVIVVEHTREDATAFCREYVQKVTTKCIEEELSTPIGKLFAGDCISGAFKTLTGDDLVFKGVSKNADMADYEIAVKESGEVLDGSSASGYDVALNQFLALCPNRR